jgi:Na+-translocating ferredoxin:NAD+ oxidoreductase subunit B
MSTSSLNSMGLQDNHQQKPDDIPIGIMNPVKAALADTHEENRSSPAQQKLAHAILAVLPQTQCTKCGYSGCAAYAKAIANQQANYNQCPPGGAEGVARLAQVLNRPIIPLNTDHGTERVRRVAVINPDQCIGCTLCIQACPTDAIIGSSKYLHQVLNDWCTGCDLCVNPCPVDCIEMVEISELANLQKTGWQAWSQNQADEARQRFEEKIQRKKAEQFQNIDRMNEKQAQKKAIQAKDAEAQKHALQKQAMIQEAIERARQRLEQPSDQ